MTEPDTKNSPAQNKDSFLTMKEYVGKPAFSIDAEELYGLNAQLNNIQKDPRAAKRMMAVADLDKDGLLSKEEFAKLAVTIQSAAPRFYAEKIQREFEWDVTGFAEATGTAREYEKKGEFSLSNAVSYFSQETMDKLGARYTPLTSEDVQSQNIRGVTVTSKTIRR